MTPRPLRLACLVPLLLLVAACSPVAMSTGAEDPPRPDLTQRAFDRGDAPARGAAPEAATFRGTLRQGIRSLTGAGERNGGYDRDLFVHWTDADGDGCDTRDEVLIAEAIRRPRVGSDCSLSGGRWRSSYDGVRTGDSSEFDVDHVVALAEAWGSGARSWRPAVRQRFANDLGDARSLIAVSASSNRSKSDRDPAEWLPPQARCAYARAWVATKIRWRLAVNPAERQALLRRADRCGDARIVVRRAR